jgi:hypothetical protein
LSNLSFQLGTDPKLEDIMLVGLGFVKILV